MNWSEIILSLIINLAVTAFGYLLVPVLYCIKGDSLTPKQIKKIIIINAACVWILCWFIQYYYTGEAKASGAVFLWSWVGFIIMKKRLCESCIQNNSHQTKTEPTFVNKDTSSPSHPQNEQPQRAYVYATAANGINVRIPADKYDEWKKEQDRIRRGEKVETDPETVERLAALMKGETTESPTAQNQITPQDCYNEKDQKIMNILTSKRIAAVISIFLCVVLYFLLLANVFTKKIDTFTVYTQEGLDVIHGNSMCQTNKWDGLDYEYSLDKTKPIIVTTAYDCTAHSWCTLCAEEMKKITITEKDYITPLLISLPISALTFAILTVKKKP